MLLGGILTSSTPCRDYGTIDLVYRNSFEADTETRDATREGALM
jgi:hypothetical protein